MKDNVVVFIITVYNDFNVNLLCMIIHKKYKKYKKYQLFGDFVINFDHLIVVIYYSYIDDCK